MLSAVCVSRGLCVGVDFLAMPPFTFAFISEIMILSSIKLYSKNVFGTFFIRNLLALLPLQMVEFQQNSNIFSLISGNLCPTLRHSMLYSTCVSEWVYIYCVCVFAKLCTEQVWSMAYRSGQEENQQECPFCRLIYCQNGSSRSIFTTNKNHLIRFQATKWAKHNWPSYDTIRYLCIWNSLRHSATGTFCSTTLHYTVCVCLCIT